jgi:two-component system, chemotaxis family, CheB/CheR fusion protein
MELPKSNEMNALFVVAVGGSAGVLEPLKEFFDHTPNDSVSYVILRHLSPSYHSMLKQILTRHSRLEIIEVEHEMALEKNKVYLLPSDRYLVLSNKMFQFVARNKTGPNRAIDVFLQSMAWDLKQRSIAVILSGAGTDGAVGARHVKEAGGLVIAQEPSSCEHASMPLKVIRAGSADHTVLPQQMPEIILRHVQQMKA